MGINAVGDSDEDSSRCAALVQVGRWLQAQGYQFRTVTPATHALVLGRRRPALAQDLRDVFGWNQPFDKSLLPRDILSRLDEAGFVIQSGPQGPSRSGVRFATLGSLIFPHSSFPTDHEASVFFGPDTYRFAALIQRELGQRPLSAHARVLDVGCGSGAGGLVAATQAGQMPGVTLCDISANALVFARASAEIAGVAKVEFAQGDLFNAVAGDFDLVVANPPYLNDATHRLYRHGGGRWGEGLSLRILREGLPRLARDGRLILYTGSSIANGLDSLHHAFRSHLGEHDCHWSYEEIDPDVFGEELREPAYVNVDRIAAVALVVCKP